MKPEAGIWVSVVATIFAAIAALSATYQAYLTRAALDGHVDSKNLEICLAFTDAVTRSLQFNEQADNAAFPKEVYDQFGLAFGRVSMLALYRGGKIPDELTARYVSITNDGPTEENLDKLIEDIGLVEEYCRPVS